MLIEENMVFNDNTLNIFTDASGLREKDRTFTGSPGFVVYRGDLKDYNNYVSISNTILRNSTNNQSEIYAIMMAIEYVVNNKAHIRNMNINIFSDSKISVFGLRNWIVNWTRGSVNGIMYSSSGEPVKNQWIFVNCVRMILDNKLNIKIYHVHGHVNKDNKREVYQFKNDFEKFNDLDGNSISYNLASKLISCNDIIDNYTRDQLSLRFSNINGRDLNTVLMKPVVTPHLNITEYLSLIKERKFK